VNWLNQNNAGPAAARNAGVSVAKGEFILPLDADDWIDPRYLDLTLPQMADESVGVVSTGMETHGKNYRYIEPRGVTLGIEMNGNELPACSLIRRKTFEEVGGYRVSSVGIGWEDWCLWLDILKRGWKIIPINTPLVFYTVKEESTATKANENQAALYAELKSWHPDLRFEESKAYCGGTFDILHPGHVKLLKWAKDTYGKVVVALNSDKFVERYKGHPTVFNYEDRKAMLLALRCVDHVIKNSGDENSQDSILRVHPTHIVNGSDWNRDRLMKQMGLTEAFLKDNKLEIVIFQDSLPIHSTNLRNKLL
jgi:cytidyltransferase-like protein